MAAFLEENGTERQDTLRGVARVLDDAGVDQTVRGMTLVHALGPGGVVSALERLIAGHAAMNCALSLPPLPPKPATLTPATPTTPLQPPSSDAESTHLTSSPEAAADEGGEAMLPAQKKPRTLTTADANGIVNANGIVPPPPPVTAGPVMATVMTPAADGATGQATTPQPHQHLHQPQRPQHPQHHPQPQHYGHYQQNRHNGHNQHQHQYAQQLQHQHFLQHQHNLHNLQNQQQQQPQHDQYTDQYNLHNQQQQQHQHDQQHQSPHPQHHPHHHHHQQLQRRRQEPTALQRAADMILGSGGGMFGTPTVDADSNAAFRRQDDDDND